MFELPLDLDCSPGRLPPIGKWRVVEETREGRLVRIIGDFDSFQEASDKLDLAQYPYIWRAFNDLGVRIGTSMPGSDDVPQAGSES